MKILNRFLLSLSLILFCNCKVKNTVDNSSNDSDYKVVSKTGDVMLAYPENKTSDDSNEMQLTDSTNKLFSINWFQNYEDLSAIVIGKSYIDMPGFDFMIYDNFDVVKEIDNGNCKYFYENGLLVKSFEKNGIMDSYDLYIQYVYDEYKRIKEINYSDKDDFAINFDRYYFQYLYQNNSLVIIEYINESPVRLYRERSEKNYYFLEMFEIGNNSIDLNNIDKLKKSLDSKCLCKNGEITEIEYNRYFEKYVKSKKIDFTYDEASLISIKKYEINEEKQFDLIESQEIQNDGSLRIRKYNNKDSKEEMISDYIYFYSDKDMKGNNRVCHIKDLKNNKDWKSAINLNY